MEREDAKTPTGFAPNWSDREYDLDAMIADAIASLLAKALPTRVIPPKPKFSYENEYVLDAEILKVSCLFDAAGLSFSLDFRLDTGRGGLQHFLEPAPEPSVSSIGLACKDQGGRFESAWDPNTGTWDKPLPLV